MRALKKTKDGRAAWHRLPHGPRAPTQVPKAPGARQARTRRLPPGDGITHTEDPALARGLGRQLDHRAAAPQVRQDGCPPRSSADAAPLATLGSALRQSSSVPCLRRVKEHNGQRALCLLLLWEAVCMDVRTTSPRKRFHNCTTEQVQPAPARRAPKPGAAESTAKLSLTQMPQAEPLRAPGPSERY